MSLKSFIDSLRPKIFDGQLQAVSIMSCGPFLLPDEQTTFLTLELKSDGPIKLKRYQMSKYEFINIIGTCELAFGDQFILRKGWFTDSYKVHRFVRQAPSSEEPRRTCRHFIEKVIKELKTEVAQRHCEDRDHKEYTILRYELLLPWYQEKQ